MDMMKNQLAGMMKQVQQMQDNVKKVQESLATLEVEGQSGAGLVKVVMTCKNDVKRVAIDPSLFGDEKAEALASEKMSAVTAGLPLPPGMKLPF